MSLQKASTQPLHPPRPLGFAEALQTLTPTPCAPRARAKHQHLMAFNKLVDVENKKENQNDLNFTADVRAGNDPAGPGRSRLPGTPSPGEGHCVCARSGAATLCFSRPGLRGACSFTLTATEGGRSSRTVFPLLQGGDKVTETPSPKPPSRQEDQGTEGVGGPPVRRRLCVPDPGPKGPASA